MKTITIAQKVADMFDNDGGKLYLDNEDRTRISEVCRKLGVVDKFGEEVVRYDFADSSAIVETAGCWDHARFTRKQAKRLTGAAARAMAAETGDYDLQSDLSLAASRTTESRYAYREAIEKARQLALYMMKGA